jgi:LysR family glycine cleavage system transcriptional activator
MRKTHRDLAMATGRRMPPLNSLKAFEAAARHQSITAAAEELSVTQSAVSKQVKRLEAYLGIELFERKYQQLVLTSKAEEYLPSIQSAFTTIAQSTGQLVGDNNCMETLHLNLVPSLSNRWLIPMLNDFKKSHPQISVNIEIGDGGVDFSATDVDIAIRVGKRQKWPGVHSEKLMDEQLIPVCAPKLLPVQLKNINSYSLLKHTSRPSMWREYLNSLGHENIALDHKLGFEHFFMLIDAAVDGLGIALVPELLIKNELAAGTLVPAFEGDYQSSYSYYFLCKKSRLSKNKIKLFREWLFSKNC